MAMNYGGIMYFPLNVNFFEDGPIELVEAKYGLEGEAAVMKLLCKMYKEKGYYLPWGEEQCTLFSHKTGIEEKRMGSIVNILVEKGFFDRECYEEQHVLTSAGIQKIWMEATKRRKRETGSLPYLLVEKDNGDKGEDNNAKTEKEGNQTGEENKQTGGGNKQGKGNGCAQNQKNCMQHEDNTPANEDNPGQSKVKQSKVEESIAVREGGSPAGSPFLTPPGYAYNRQTHNYDGLMFTLQQMRITNPEEVNAILRLSDYGRLRGYVWQVIHSTRWGEVIAKGKYMVSALVKERKKTGS